MTVLDLRECSLTWDSTSPEETERMGEKLGALLQSGDVVALCGELGSGKTVLVRGLATGCGCAKGDVHSPSFTLVNEYESRTRAEPRAGSGREKRLIHVDLYRIRSDDELPGIGWDDIVNSRHVVAVEWAERALRWMPRDHLWVNVQTLGPDRRRLSVQGTGPRSVELALKWVEAGGFTPELT